MFWVIRLWQMEAKILWCATTRIPTSSCYVLHRKQYNISGYSTRNLSRRHFFQLPEALHSTVHCPWLQWAFIFASRFFLLPNTSASTDARDSTCNLVLNLCMPISKKPFIREPWKIFLKSQYKDAGFIWSRYRIHESRCTIWLPRDLC